ncbi:MAG: HDIG domain-containing protein [Bacteroidaceae bacterium]|nr:HDIG domain-containing protein [Bacteroidaceae bacterium]
MKDNKQAKRKVYGKQIFKGLLVVLSTLIIVYFMPRTETVGYSYEVGYPWINKQLIAPFTFAIYKSDSVIQHERDSVKRAFLPYYRVDTKVNENMKKRLLKTKAQEWSGPNAALYIKHISIMLDSVYSRGIIATEEYDSLLKDHKYTIKVVENRNAKNTVTKLVFTPRSAYEYIMFADTAKFSRLVMQHFDINDLISPNLIFDKEKSKAELEDMLSSISGASGMVQSGQKIIDRGEIVDEKKAAIIESLVRESSKYKEADSIIRLKMIGQIAYVLFICLLLLSYMNLFRNDYFENVGTGILLFGLMDFFCCVAGSMVAHNFYHILILPCCMVPIFIRVFMDSRTAFMFHCATVMIISSFLREPYEFLILQFATGMVAIQTLRELSQRSQIIKTAAVITLTYCVIHASFMLIQNDEIRFDRSIYIYMMVNGILLLFTYPLLYVFEKVFGFVSDVTLVELSNISNPLLQRMSEIAPGTFQHSMQVANLSAEVAKKIGARSQLVRTGALYHDIGKLERPVFFTENQKGISPHKHLTPERSAEVIISHVTNGLSLAEKNNLPEPIKRFILTHHGLGKTKYFYITWKNEHPGEEPEQSLFTYPGPNPSTKEEAILMMADSVEAASRSLTEYTEESISNLVDKIIDGQMQEKFFSNCDITFKDIATAKEVFKEKLKIVYHTRISYPELNNKK